MVQRSPAHFSTGTFYWAHHEKMCVIDEAIAFMGGLDLCFGRWDTPQHILVDDGNMEGAEGSTQIWPGKDYSNARVMDFHTLNKPHEDMYDRSKVARMPWHDVGIQFVGQPARDLCRHFVDRYVLFLYQANAWLNQLLDIVPDGTISSGLSTVVNDIPVENNIGDALVDRIIRAHKEKTPWRACILIPLLPGFTFPIDHNDASSIRLIVEHQNRSICRGPHSIFSRLRKEGIDSSRD
ncbi:Phospholipase D1 [Tulasnella sp. 408]|nr:Phospholipase D1 [Tulasnella sp. 408]